MPTSNHPTTAVQFNRLAGVTASDFWSTVEHECDCGSTGRCRKPSSRCVDGDGRPRLALRL